MQSREDFITFGGARRGGEFARREYPGRGASENPPESGVFRSRRGTKKAPQTFPARTGAIFAPFAGSSSPLSASTRRVGRTRAAAQDTNSPNTLARARSVQPAQGERESVFSVRLPKVHLTLDQQFGNLKWSWHKFVIIEQWFLRIIPLSA